MDIRTEFPETSFRMINPAEFILRVKTGIQNASTSSVFIAGICRNVGHILETNLLRLQRISSLFKSSKTFIYENDSEDNTKEILKNWRDKNTVIVMEDKGKEFHLGGIEKSRLTDMAEYRNKYLDYLFSLKNSYDYLIVVDLDILGGWSYEGIMHSLSFDFDFMGANSILLENNCRYYYDCFALRWEEINKKEITQNGQWINQAELEKGQKIIPVKSCFGGIGIYRNPTIFSSLRYQDWDCDHVTLHSQMIDKGINKLYLNPSLITLYNRTIYT